MILELLQMGYNKNLENPFVRVGRHRAYYRAIASSLFKKERSKNEYGCESISYCNFWSVEWNLLEGGTGFFSCPECDTYWCSLFHYVEIGLIAPRNLP